MRRSALGRSVPNLEHAVREGMKMRMSNRWRLWARLCCLCLCAVSLCSWAAPGTGRRVALIIGNSDYQFTDTLPKLQNPTNDAQDMARVLREFGFEVIERENLTLEGMNQAVVEFGRKLVGSDAALFYYAGHGLQVKNQNYLMPINASGESEATIPFQGMNINQVLEEMDNAKSQANIVILDACRNNPITGKFRSGKTRGLATPDTVPKGTVIVYATDPGNVAQDGTGRNGLFTGSLLTAFKGDDLSLDGVLTAASAEVERISNKEQSPYVNGPKTLQKTFFFRLGATTRMLAPSSAPTVTDMSIADLRKEQEKRKGWTEWQQRMKTDFDTVAQLNADAELQLQAWERFLSTFVQKNPYSDEDDALRAKARAAKDGVVQDIKQRSGKAVSGNVRPAVAPGKVFKDCPECPEMVELPGGPFMMGSMEDETGRLDDEVPLHQVNLPRFAIGKTEVTQAQWKAFMGNTPSSAKSCGLECPVESVSWNDAQEFLRRLSAKTGRKYRLPSEAEWEYACRAGGRDLYCGGSDLEKLGWHVGNSRGSVHPVGERKPNGFGLYDMSGNVLEWVDDFWHAGYNGAPTDGSPWFGPEQPIRVLRGGAWGLPANKARAANRDWMRLGERSFLIGFRAVRVLP